MNDKDFKRAIGKIAKWEQVANAECNNSTGRKEREAYFAGEANALTKVINYLKGVQYRKNLATKTTKE